MQHWRYAERLFIIYNESIHICHCQQYMLHTCMINSNVYNKNCLDWSSQALYTQFYEFVGVSFSKYGNVI